MTLQLDHTAGHFVGLDSIVSKLALARSVSGFVAFLLVDVKSLPQSFRVQLINLSSSHQIFWVLNLWYLILIIVTLNLTDYVIGLSWRYLTIAEVIVVYGDIEMTRICSAWRHRLSHVTGVLKQGLDKVLRRTRTLLDDSRYEHRRSEIVRFEVSEVSSQLLRFKPTSARHSMSAISILKLVKMHLWVWRNGSNSSHMWQKVMRHVLPRHYIVIRPHYVLTMTGDIVWGEKVVVRRLSILTSLVVVLIRIWLSS